MSNNYYNVPDEKWDKMTDAERGAAMHKHEREKKLAELDAASKKIAAPRPDPEVGSPEWNLRFPTQIVTHLNPPARRYGDAPMEINESEADRIKRLGPQLRMEELERRVAHLEDILRRQLGDAYGHGGEVYR